jgi:trehalose utilization protein
MNKKVVLPIFISLVALPFFSSSVFSASTVHYNKGAAAWNYQPGVKCYNIYYKETADKKYMYSARCVPSGLTSYTLQYLKRGATYVYNVSALNFAGKEIWWSGEKQLKSSLMQ